jgi:hypothetical protein
VSLYNRLNSSFEGLSLAKTQQQQQKAHIATMASTDVLMHTDDTFQHDLSQQEIQELYYGLMNAVKACSERGMYSSAKW